MFVQARNNEYKYNKERKMTLTIIKNKMIGFWIDSQRKCVIHISVYEHRLVTAK